ncbi:MAG TPA: anti-sigma F factor antagonist [Firmicutes bacterium]|nr:anti-sigma F factor antagonist [Bacillota bacterium]
MTVETKRSGRTLLVRCSGELDLASAAEFRRVVDSELEEWEDVRTLVLNLGQVTFVDSSGLGAILGRYKRIQQRQGRMVLVEVPAPVQRLLEFSGIFKLIPVRASEEEALKLA